MYFYHPDHLGSSSYITDKNGEIIQHTEYIAFGEVLVDEHSTTNKMPYLFNGKELDYETGLYYYGARYYDAKTSLWLNTDPLSGYNPIQETEHYIDGQHNGGVHNPMNMATYSYTYQNPVLYVDPNGKQVLWEKIKNGIESIGNSAKELFTSPIFLDAVTGGGYSRGLREIEYAKTNPSTMEWATFQMGENAQEIKSEYMGGYGGGKVGRVFSANFDKGKLYNSMISNSKNNMTSIGRALQKHSGRKGSSFEGVKFSGKTATEDGLGIAKDILNAKKQLIDIEKNGTKTIYDKKTGRGINIDRKGDFGGFRDLKERIEDKVKETIRNDK